MLPASRLAFASAPQSIGTGICSAPVIVETRNALGVTTNVVSNTIVSFNSTSGPSTVYLGPNCLGVPVTMGVIPAGQSQVRFSIRTSNPINATLTATSLPLASASQSLIVFQLPTQLTFTASVTPPLRAGSCFAASVEARGPMGVPLPVQSPTLVALTSSIANGTLFFADPTCTVLMTGTSISLGSSSATVYVKPLSGVPQVLSATASFGTGTLAISPVPIVRRGDCTVQGSLEQCPIDMNSIGQVIPATPGRSFLITQSIGDSRLGAALPLDVEARCRLQGNDISCTRRGSGLPGLTRDALTHFQVVELPTGLFVQAASSGNCSGTITLQGMVDPTRTFVLKSVVGSGSSFDEDDSVAATLATPLAVTLSSSACEGYDVQVVQWDGVSVSRGQLSPMAIPIGSFMSSVVLPLSSTTSTIVLSQPSNDLMGSSPPCQVLGRAEVFSPNELRFFRGANRVTCVSTALPRIVWERIDFGTRARVWPHTVTMTTNTEVFSIPIMPVDPTRSFVITSSQQLGGQGSGETNGNSFSESTDSAVQTRLIVGTNPVVATAVEVVRQASTSTAIITFYVVQIEP